MGAAIRPQLRLDAVRRRDRGLTKCSDVKQRHQAAVYGPERSVRDEARCVSLRVHEIARSAATAPNPSWPTSRTVIGHPMPWVTNAHPT
jgi:hypothetical protein